MDRAALGGLTAAALMISSAAHAQFTRMYFDQTTGRVGYHMSVGFPLVVKSDVPRGNTGGAISGTCSAYMIPKNYEGELPPGLKFTNAGDVIFSGTPRQPGTWRGSLALEVYCTGGPDTNHYQRSIPITWQIEP